MSSLQSGLGTVKRDWSMSSASEAIEWPVSPERPPPPPPPKKVMTAEDKKRARLQDIMNGLQERREDGQDALMNGDPKPVPQATSTIRVTKRPSPDPETAPPSKKKRQLPPGWELDHASSSSSTSNSSSNRLRRSTGASSTSIRSSTTSTSASSTAPDSKKAVSGVFLSAEQTKILQLAREGHSLFYTGSAGTGKSVLLREIIKAMRQKNAKAADSVAVTASTGIAACNIGGVTIHSFAGIGVGADSVDKLVDRVRKNRKASSRWARTKVLIIDEISMVDGDLFDKLSDIGALLRKSSEPFGGIQVIVTGDFFQLPPVTRNGQPTFAFEAQHWREALKYTYKLTKVFRQTDNEFVDMLNEMRFGNLSQASIRKFKELARPTVFEDGIQATELFPRREQVDTSNITRLKSLGDDSRLYRAQDGGTLGDEQREKVLGNFMAPAAIELKPNAQVMLIKNMDENLVNGSMGRVLSFMDEGEWRAQGLGGEDEREEGKNAKGGGAKAGGGVGLSKWPVVEFQVPNGRPVTILVQPETWKVELPSGEVQASRTQLPLILSWAMSIHKSQGQTLDRVKVDLGRVFEKGQAYVALSRATSMAGLQVLNFNPAKVQAHPKVIEWSKTLAEIHV